MIKKIITFIFLLFIFSQNFSFAGNLNYDKSVYPYSYTSFFPQEDAKVLTKYGDGTSKSAFSVGTNGEKSYIFNTLAIHSPKTTPGYNSQIYNIFPEDYNGVFGPITINIRNLEYPSFLFDKLTPIVTIEYRDENNSPIYTKYGNFNPLAYSTYGLETPINGSISSVNTNAGKWVKTGPGFMHDSTYAMDINLPMDELSDRINNTDLDTGIQLSKLKYIKVKISLVSREINSTTGESFLECQMLKPNIFGLKKTGYEKSLSYFGGKEDDNTLNKYHLYFFNGSSYEMLSPVTLGENFYKSNDVGFDSRKLLAGAAEYEVEQKNTLSNSTMIQIPFDSDYAYTNTTGENGYDQFWPTELSGQLYKVKGNFAIEDCLQLSIKKESPANKVLNYRPEKVLQNENGNWISETANFSDGVGTTSDTLMYKAYAPGAGFGYEPKNFNSSGYFSSKAAVFQYNIGISGLTPDVVSKNPGITYEEELQEASKLNPPKLMGSYASYDWKNEKPIVSKLSYSANLNEENKIKRISETKDYCLTIIEKSDFYGIDLNENGDVSSIEKKATCLGFHGLRFKNGIENGEIEQMPSGKLTKNYLISTGKDESNGENIIDVYDDYYQEVLDVTSSINNDNYGKGKDLVTNSNGTNSYPDTYSQIETLFASIVPNIGRYIRIDGFFSTMPYNIRNQISTENFIKWKKDIENPYYDPDYDRTKLLGDVAYKNIIDNSSIDESFQWQTFYPFDDDRDHLYAEGSAGTKAFGYNMSLLKGTKYLMLGTYDLDKKINGGNPQLDIDIKIRPSYINNETTKSSSNYTVHGPSLVVIDGTFKGGVDTLSTPVKNAEKPVYLQTTKEIQYESWNGEGSIQKLADGYDGNILKDAFVLPGPEGNNDTTFYKVDLQSLYNSICNYNETLKKCEPKATSGWTENDAKTLKDWKFNEDGSLAETIYLRLVITNPDLTSTNAYAPNVIYLYSNGAIGNMPKQTEGNKISSNLELIHSNKKLFGSINGYEASYFEQSEDEFKPRITDEIKDENTIITTYRIQSDNLYLNTIINPYLLKPFSTEQVENFENIDFTNDEKLELEKIRILTNESGEENSLGLGTKESDTVYSYNGKNYNKLCIDPRDTISKGLSDKNGNLINNEIPYQQVCYYINETSGYSKSDLQSDKNLRILSFNSDLYLPFVDVYVKYAAKKTTNLSEIKHSYYNYNILNSAISLINIKEKNESNSYKLDTEDIDNDGNKTETLLKPLPKNYSDLILDSNKNSTLVKENSIRLLNSTIFDRFNLVDYTTMEDEIPASIKKIRGNIPLFIYFDEVKNGNVTQNYQSFDENNKHNNFTINIKTLIGDGNYTNGDGLKATWDYPKINDENDDSLKPNPDDDFPTPSIGQKEIGDNIIAYPKIINTTGKDICDLTVSYEIVDEISSINNGDNQLISDTFTPYVNNISPFGSGQTIWIDGNVKRDIVLSKDFKYRYELNGINNAFSYKVFYKFCGEETEPYKETVSPPITFNIDGSDSAGAGICNLNATTPVENTNLYRGGNIDYKITCFNNTGNDIYNLKIKLPLPDDLNYKEGISNDWISLGSLNNGQTIDYITNPIDMIKKTTIKDEARIGTTITGRLDYTYTVTEQSITEETGYDQITHNVISNHKDQTTIEILRGPCDNRNSFDYNPGTQQYPFKTPAGMCSSKIPSSDNNGNLVYSNDNSSCLIVRYYRTAKDELINNGAYPNLNANLYWGNLTNYNDLENTCSNQNSTSLLEGATRSKYINTRVNFDIDIPNGYVINGIENGYTDYNDASIGSITRNTLNLLEKKYNYSIGISSSSETATSVNSNKFQNVLKDGSSDLANSSSLTNALVELRIPLRSTTKGNSIEDDEKMKAKAENSYINFDRKIWSQFDSASSCQRYCARRNSKGRCTSYKYRIINDGTSTEINGNSPIQNNGLAFPPAENSEIPVCISSDGKWIQVLNGGMYTNDLSNLKDTEHQINPLNPASYNTNWFYNQNTNVATPGGFMKYGGTTNELFNMDTQFQTDFCYQKKENNGDYDYSQTYFPTAPDYNCSDGTIPWFYSIIKGNYGYLYKFSKTQLKDISSSVIDLSKDYNTSTKISDRVWLYERALQSEDLVIGKDNINTIKIIGKGSIFITENQDNLQDKSAVLNINSNIEYNNTQIQTSNKINDYIGDALAIVVNGDMKISSKVTKMEGIYFVDGDVYVEESKNQIEIDRLYVTGNIYIKRTSTVNSSIDKYTLMQDSPIFRVKGSTRYLYIQPKIIQDLNKFYKETEIPANDLNVDCTETGLCQ